MFGCDVVDKKNVINPVEGAIVKEIFSLYAQDYNTAAYIADEMRKRGIRTKKGKYLTEKAIYKMLQNTKYNGKIKHGDTVYDNIYPKIVDDVLWQSVQHIRDGNKHAPGRKKEIFDFILSGKLVCGDCKRLMVGVSGTSKTGAKHYYYTCLTHSRDKKPCGLKTACKKEIEDIVINTTWQLLSDNDSVKALAELICRRINEKSRNNANIKSLETKRTAALKASRNLIAAIEQGIITEQTKERLKELETQISQLDFDIEQEKQRTFAEISPEKVIRFLNKAICGSVQDISVRKALVKYLIRDIVLYNDKIIINYYFAEPLKKHTNSIASVIETEKQSREAASLSEIQSSYKGDNSPPEKPALFERVLLFARDGLAQRRSNRCSVASLLTNPPLPPEKPALSERVLLLARDGILYLSLTRLAQRRNNRCSVASLLTNPTVSERKPACLAGFPWLFQNAIPHRTFTLLSASGR